MATGHAVALQHEGGGQSHHGQRCAGQNHQDDEVDLRQAGGAPFAHRHFKRPATITTAVPAAGAGAAPLVYGRGRSGPACSSIPLPPRHRRPARLAAPRLRLAGGSGVTRPTDAVEAAGPVQAAAGVEAGPAGTVVQVDGAEAPGETGGAEAREAIDAIQAGGAVGTRSHQAVVHVRLTAPTREAGQAAARQIHRKAVGVFTETAIFTWRPPLGTGAGLQLAVPAVESSGTQTGVPGTVLHHAGRPVLTRRPRRAQRQVFVTKAPPPAGLAAALPRLLTGTVAAAGRRHAALAPLALPPGVTPADSRLITAAVGDVTAAVTSLTFAERGHEDDAEAQQDGGHVGHLEDRDHLVDQ